MIYLTTHSCKDVRNKRPDHDVLLKWIDASQHSLDCWHWEIDEKNRRFNSKNHAILVWKKHRSLPAVVLCVARLMIEDVFGPIPKRTGFVLTCGNPRCVSPYHWQQKRPSPDFIFQCNQHGWFPVFRQTGQPIDHELIRPISIGNAVHLARIGVAPAPSFTAVCGARINPATSILLAEQTPITCKGGC